MTEQETAGPGGAEEVELGAVTSSTATRVTTKYNVTATTPASVQALSVNCVDLPDLAAVIPYNAEDHSIYLVEQVRAGLFAKHGWKTDVELPAGFVDPGETAEQAALRELEEETGLIRERLAQSNHPRQRREHVTYNSTCIADKQPSAPKRACIRKVPKGDSCSEHGVHNDRQSAGKQALKRLRLTSWTSSISCGTSENFPRTRHPDEISSRSDTSAHGFQDGQRLRLRT